MKIIKKLLKYLAIFVLALMTYLLLVTLLSFVSVNEDLAENKKNTYGSDAQAAFSGGPGYGGKCVS